MCEKEFVRIEIKQRDIDGKWMVWSLIPIQQVIPEEEPFTEKFPVYQWFLTLVTPSRKTAFKYMRNKMEIPV